MFNAQYENRGCDANQQIKIPSVERSAYLIGCLKLSVKETSRRRVRLVGSPYRKEKALEMPWKPVRNSLTGSPSLAGQSSGSTPLINVYIASCSVCHRRGSGRNE